jgi:hypothetical protein
MQPNPQYAAQLYGQIIAPQQPPYAQPGYPTQPQQYPPQQYAPPTAPQQYQPAGVMPAAPPQFAAPAPTGDRLRPEDCAGHLLAVCPIVVMPGFFPARANTDGSVKPPADAVRCDVVDLDANNGQGATYVGIMWGQKVLCESLGRQLGEVVLGRMGRGVAKGGNNAPWLLVDASTDPEAIQRGQAFFAAHPNWRNEPSTGVQQQSTQAAQAAPGTPWPAGAVQAQQYAPAGPPPVQYGPPQGQYPPYPVGPPVQQYDPAAQAMYQQAAQPGQ